MTTICNQQSPRITKMHSSRFLLFGRDTINRLEFLVLICAMIGFGHLLQRVYYSARVTGLSFTRNFLPAENIPQWSFNIPHEYSSIIIPSIIIAFLFVPFLFVVSMRIKDIGWPSQISIPFSIVVFWPYFHEFATRVRYEFPVLKPVTQLLFGSPLHTILIPTGLALFVLLAIKSTAKEGHTETVSSPR